MPPWCAVGLGLGLGLAVLGVAVGDGRQEVARTPEVNCRRTGTEGGGRSPTPVAIEGLLRA